MRDACAGCAAAGATATLGRGRLQTQLPPLPPPLPLASYLTRDLARLLADNWGRHGPLPTCPVLGQPPRRSATPGDQPALMVLGPAAAGMYARRPLKWPCRSGLGTWGSSRSLWSGGGEDCRKRVGGRWGWGQAAKAAWEELPKVPWRALGARTLGLALSLGDGLPRP